jgi:RNA polymerase sigma-70 factor (ECF subfamily)
LLLARLQIDKRIQGKLSASDLVQETCLQVHRDFPQFRGATEREFIAWLRKVMSNQIAKNIRHYFGAQRRNPRLERRLRDDLDRSSSALEALPATPDASPGQKAMQREQCVLLADALGQLPSHYREVMILHYLQGLTMSQVATEMGRSVDSVRKLWARALIKLRTLMGDQQ